MMRWVFLCVLAALVVATGARINVASHAVMQSEGKADHATFASGDADDFWKTKDITIGGKTYYNQPSVNLGHQPSWPAWLKKCRITTDGTDRKLTLVRILGQGAAGRVFLAKDKGGKKVAVKIQRKTSVNEREASIFSRLAEKAPLSKYLAHLEPAFEDTRTCCGLPCLVMEFIDGMTLEDWGWRNQFGLWTRMARTLARVTNPFLRGHASPEARFSEMRSFVLQSLVAFHHLELAKVYNEDQRPANIMIRKSTGQVVFFDFGVATLDSREGSSSLPRLPWFYFNQLAGVFRDNSDEHTAYTQMTNRLTVPDGYASARSALNAEACFFPKETFPEAATDKKTFFRLHRGKLLEMQLDEMEREGDLNCSLETTPPSF